MIPAPPRQVTSKLQIPLRGNLQKFKKGYQQIKASKQYPASKFLVLVLTTNFPPCPLQITLAAQYYEIKGLISIFNILIKKTLFILYYSLRFPYLSDANFYGAIYFLHTYNPFSCSKEDTLELLLYPADQNTQICYSTNTKFLVFSTYQCSYCQHVSSVFELKGKHPWATIRFPLPFDSYINPIWVTKFYKIKSNKSMRSLEELHTIVNECLDDQSILTKKRYTRGKV